MSVNQNQRMAHLESLREEMRTMIFYEAPHKLCRTLSDMAAGFFQAEVFAKSAISLCGRG